MMTRVILLLALCPVALAAQDTYLGVRAGRNVAQIEGDLTRSGLAVGVFAQSSVSKHVGLEWDVDWMRSAVAQLDASSIASAAELEYLTTDLVAEMSASRPFFDGTIIFGATASGGGWMGVRTGGSLQATDARRLDFGQLWGVSLFAIHGVMRFEVDLQAYHGEREVWERGPRQSGSRASIGIAYRIR